MGKFDKYKKAGDQTNLDKYKKKSGESFEEIEKTIEQKDEKQVVQAQQKGSTGGAILIVILGVVTVLVWFLAISKLG
ncbi:hypothetical protein J7L48_04815 [bacterium]|nr:hypothetical protein [bacterium]